MNFLVTGAAGFLGRLLTLRLLARHAGAGHRFVLADRQRVEDLDDPRISQLVGDLPELPGLDAALAAADVVFHLAALPGGAAERDYEASRRINLQAALALLERLAQRAQPARLVYASSIAVFGEPLPALIDDDTVPRPTMTYGAHKLMVETALTNLARLGRVDGYALRLPGLVARPGGNSGMKSAFMSELFHAAKARRPFTVPVGPDATIWVMSAGCAAANLIHAAEALRSTALAPRSVTLPALRVTMRELVAAIARCCGYDAALVSYERDAVLEGQFGSLPPLRAAAAEALGFRHDGDLDALVAQAFRDAGYPGGA